MQLLKVTLGIVVYCIQGSALTVVNKLCMHNFPYPNFVLILQCTVTIGLVLVGSRCIPQVTGVIEPLQWHIVKEWILLTITFVVMLVSSMYALEYVTVPTLVVVRNLATLVTAVQDVLILKNEIQATEGASVVMILIGSYFYGQHDINFHLVGYIWLFVNVVSTSGFQIYVKYLVKRFGLNSFSMTYYNNVLSLPFLIVMCVFGNELSSIWILPTLSGSVQGLIGLSTFLGFGCSVAGFFLNQLITATTLMVVNNVNKFVLIFISELLIEQTQTAASGMGCTIVLLSGAAYSYFKMAGPLPPTSLEEGKTSKIPTFSGVLKILAAFTNSVVGKVFLGIACVFMCGIGWALSHYHSLTKAEQALASYLHSHHLHS
eukprot:gene11082-13099_t